MQAVDKGHQVLAKTSGSIRDMELLLSRCMVGMVQTRESLTMVQAGPVPMAKDRSRR
jgi:hypothetical protein